MRVGAAGIGREKEPCLSDHKILEAEMWLVFGAAQGLIKRPKTRDAMKAGKARHECLEFYEQVLYAFSEFGWRDFARPRAGALHHIGKAEPIFGEKPIMLRQERIDTDPIAGAATQHGARKRRPEAIGPAREIMPLLNGIERRIDANENHHKMRSQEIGKSRAVVG